jgi:hypothetical protein
LSFFLIGEILSCSIGVASLRTRFLRSELAPGIATFAVSSLRIAWVAGQSEHNQRSNQFAHRFRLRESATHAADAVRRAGRSNREAWFGKKRNDDELNGCERSLASVDRWFNCGEIRRTRPQPTSKGVAI